VERGRRRVGDALDPPDRATPAGALLRALVIGARDRLAPETERAFERSGTAHLLSVSGLHVSWAFAMTQFGVRWLLRALPGAALARRAPAIAQAIGLAAGAASALLAGLGPPALRAAAMAGAGTAAALGGRPAAVWNGLLAAAFAALLVEPASMFEGALWLSFVAVAGILLWRPAGSAAARAVGCTLGAGLATAPLAAGLGLPVPAGSLVANAVAIPWFGVVVMPLAFALVAADALAPPLVPALRPLALGAAALGTRAMDALASADLLAHLPHPRALALGGAGGLLALRLLWRGAPLPALGLALGATLASVPLAVSSPRPDAAQELLFLDVGHGDAVLVRSGAHAWLVDAGPRAGRFDAGRSVVVPALRAEGIERLERLLVTHADADHIGGAAAVLAAHPVDEVWIGRGTYESPAALPLRRAAARRGVPLRIVAAGVRARIGSLDAELLWPPADAPPEASNPGSLVLRIRGVGGCAVLGGDAPAAVERALAPGLGRCALLKLGHHGSGTSTDPAWLAALAPQVAVASAGRRVSGSLPHPAVRARLRAAAVSVWETRRFGALRVRLAEGGPLVLPYLSAPLDEGG
jgi:competence protein ComEC